MLIKMPKGAYKILQTLISAGFEAFIVGGCVRDSIMEKEPTDWDITTSAKPDDIKYIFKNHRLICIGQRHGTIAVCCGNVFYEITTYRIDGEYTDHRRPNNIQFTSNLKDDLARRDFTINAMAYNHIAGIIDPFGGLDDIKNRIIRCVGNPKSRFDEDYLRIMRAYRFSAALNFDLEPQTRNAAKNAAVNLPSVAAERICAELTKLLELGSFEMIKIFLEDCADVLFPEIANLRGVEQNNIYHCYDVYNHTLEVLRNVRNDAALRLAALYHDAGKFPAQTIDSKGIYHFYGHAVESAEIVKATLKKLKFDNATIDRVVAIVSHHCDPIENSSVWSKKFLNKHG
ncbi:MAG: HD domain-containing protein, partial [Defluviitaleaceae bacterium]|nr:HD domain-containing protein [Defluviitaleaceae bacterium]